MIENEVEGDFKLRESTTSENDFLDTDVDFDSLFGRLALNDPNTDIIA